MAVADPTVGEAYATALAVLSVADGAAALAWRRIVQRENRAFGARGDDWVAPSSGDWARPWGAIWKFLDGLPTAASDLAVYGDAMIKLGLVESRPSQGTLKRFFGALKGNKLKLELQRGGWPGRSCSRPPVARPPSSPAAGATPAAAASAGNVAIGRPLPKLLSTHSVL